MVYFIFPFVGFRPDVSHLKAVKMTLQTATICMICFKVDFNQSGFALSTISKITLVVSMVERLFIINNRF